jgi:hypothetical protein
MAEPGKKGALLIALGGPKKAPGHSEPDDDQMDGPSDGDADNLGMDSIKQQASDDVFDALKADDRALFADAFDRYVKACM